MKVLLLLIGIFVCLLLAYRLYRSSRRQVLKPFFIPAIALKIACGIAVGFLYSFYYTLGDTLTFFSDASVLYEVAFEKPMVYLKVLFNTNEGTELVLAQLQSYSQPRAFFMVKLLSVVNLLSGNNYWLSSVYFSLISFFGVWHLTNRLVDIFPKTKLAAIVSFLFLPSFVFWSSGILKESIAVMAITLVVSIWLPFIAKGDKPKITEILGAILLLYLLWVIKYYYAAVLAITLPMLIFWASIKGVSSKRRTILVAASLVTGLITIALLGYLRPNLDLNQLPEVISENYSAYVEKSAPDDFIRYEGLDGTWSGILFNMPKALLSGLFRPVIWEATDILKVMAAVENLVILIFSFVALSQLPRLRRNRLLPVIISCIFFVGILATFLALSVPNFGTLSRFRSGYICFFAFLILANNPLFLILEKKVMQVLNSKSD
ncbi:MAG: hypothetical protein AAFX87_04195 [Bacteroidota bacterium]